MTDFDIKLPQIKTIEELSQSRRQLEEKERQQAEEAARRRKARAEAARRRRQRNRLVVASVVCISIAILAVALNRDKTPNLPSQGDALDGPIGSYNDNDNQGNGLNAVAPVEPEEPQQPKTEEEKVRDYILALGKGEATYDYADPSGRISQNKSATKMVALTFDDGPYPGKTEEYLKILQEYDVPATFFCLGSYVEKNPDTAKAIVDAGCELASHSWDHKNMPKQSQEVMQEDFRKTAEAFQSAVGFAPYLFRAPYGSTDDTLRQVAAANGATMIFWSVDTNDWKKPAADTLVNRAVNDARDGSIILMHENKANTLEALPTIITYLKAKGYELVTVSRLLYENSAAQKEDLGTADAGAGQESGGENPNGGGEND